jgi:diguanylate cyclase (GGDEF)-like protein
LLGEIVQLRRQQAAHVLQVQHLQRAANLDELTGINGRRGWNAALPTWSGGLLAVLDIDRFKRINDQLGHDAGDEVLRQVARRLVQSVRQRDFVARLGGDEFGLLITGVDERNAFDVADRIRQAATHKVAGDMEVTASLGFAVSLQHPDVGLVRRADEALRTAKAAGRNRTAAAG